jgi:hypothetical protein
LLIVIVSFWPIIGEITPQETKSVITAWSIPVAEAASGPARIAAWVVMAVAQAAIATSVRRVCADVREVLHRFVRLRPTLVTSG